jgi:hypothetical protein
LVGGRSGRDVTDNPVAHLDIRETGLYVVCTIVPQTVFEDGRGNYVELYDSETYRASGVDVLFVQDDIPTSTRHVLRGLHGDATTWKLVSCLHGRIDRSARLAGTPSLANHMRQALRVARNSARAAA